LLFFSIELYEYFRFYDELDYERRVRKRRTKLLSSCEDAFTHVRKYLHEKSGSHIPMDSREAAQVIIFSNIFFL
jgi:vang-like